MPGSAIVVTEGTPMDRQERRRVARVRANRAFRKRAFRDHPIVMRMSMVLNAAGFVSLFLYAYLAVRDHVTDIPRLQWTAFVLLTLPQLWVAYILRLGPLSSNRRSRAAFWRGVRGLSWIISGYVTFLFLVTSVLFFHRSQIIAKLLGISTSDYVKQLFFAGDKRNRVLWFFLTCNIAICATLIASRRLKPLIRRLEGCCVHCGYSLRGLPEPRCPECGTPFEKPHPPQLRQSTPDINSD